MHRSTVNTSRAEHNHADIYGSRVGKEELEKDPVIFEQGPAPNLNGKTHTLTH